MSTTHEETYLAEWRRRAEVDARDRAAYRPGGQDRPDEWDEKARAVIEYRDRIADSVSGQVPAVGTAEWAAADWRTQTAAYARHERDVAAARGKEISNRMAKEAGERRDRVESSHAVADEYTRRRGHGRYRTEVAMVRRERAKVVIPFQRTADTVARAREAAKVAQQEVPAMAEEPHAASDARAR